MQGGRLLLYGEDPNPGKIFVQMEKAAGKAPKAAAKIPTNDVRSGQFLEQAQVSVHKL